MVNENENESTLQIKRNKSTPNFARFLETSARGSGHITSIHKVSQSHNKNK